MQIAQLERLGDRAAMQYRTIQYRISIRYDGVIHYFHTSYKKLADIIVNSVNSYSPEEEIGELPAAGE